MVVVPECRGAGCWLREVWHDGNDVLRQMNIAGLKSPFLSVGTTHLHVLTYMLVIHIHQKSDNSAVFGWAL